MEGSKLVDERDLPGPSGRVLLAALAFARGPVARSRLASILWDGEVPEGYDRSLNPLLSKLRSAVERAGADRTLLVSASGSIELRRTASVWVDVDAATTAVDAAEGSLRRGEPREAWTRAAVATSILNRPFLEGVDLTWVEARRREIHALRLRALEAAAHVWMQLDDPRQAVVAATRLVEADPLRETSYADLIRAHLYAGNRAEALRAFGECEQMLLDRLGVEPSAIVQNAYEEALGIVG